MAHTDYFRVARIEDIRKPGWLKIRLLGRDIVIFTHNDDYIAVELGGVAAPAMKSFPAKNDVQKANETREIIKRLMAGPSDSPWGKLKHFPVRIDEGFIFVGITS